jgi:Cu+-exporting ATPase
MRRPLLALVFAAGLALACKGEARTLQLEIAVDGMTCDSCVQAITHELGRLEGVKSVDVDLEGGKAVVVYTEGAVEPASIEQAIEDIGYEAELGEAQPAPSAEKAGS